MKDGNEFLKVRGPAVRDRGGSDRIFKDQVPADDPGEELTESGVRVRVSRTGDRHHRSKLCITERREHTSKSRHHEREHRGRAGAIVRRYPRQDEDAGADDRADTERSQLYWPKDAAQTVLALHLVEQHAERFCSKQLTRHCDLRWSSTNFSLSIVI